MKCNTCLFLSELKHYCRTVRNCTPENPVNWKGESTFVVPKMSTGDEATLGNYKKLAEIVFGKDSKAVKFLDEKIADSEKGESELVIADETQMIFALSQINFTQ